jgi:hypothetical protein
LSASRSGRFGAARARGGCAQILRQGVLDWIGWNIALVFAHLDHERVLDSARPAAGKDPRHPC